jgi:hypothetical protein
MHGQRETPLRVFVYDRHRVQFAIGIHVAKGDGVSVTGVAAEIDVLTHSGGEGAVAVAELSDDYLPLGALLGEGLVENAVAIDVRKGQQAASFERLDACDVR